MTRKNIIIILTTLLLTACGGGSDNAPAPPANVSPTANYTAACTNKDCTFTDSSTDSDGTIASYAWDFGDGSTSTEANPTHQFADYGDYTVQLTVTDDDDATGLTSQTVSMTIDVHNQIATIDVINNSVNILMSQDFNHRPDGLYAKADLISDLDCDFAGCGNPDDAHKTDEVAIAKGELKVTLKQDMIGTSLQVLKFLGADYNELYLTFKVRFDQNYDTAARGGKLMGLAGDDKGEWPPVGCNEAPIDGGFSSRFTYGTNTTLTNYIYHQDKTRTCGESDDVYNHDGTTRFMFQKDVTYILEMHVVMNDPNQKNGYVETFINGIKMNKTVDYTFSESGLYGINQFIFVLYIGGQSDAYKLEKPSTIYLDDFVISTSSVVTTQ